MRKELKILNSPKMMATKNSLRYTYKLGMENMNRIMDKV